MNRLPAVILVFVLVALSVALIFGSAASANHVAGATYTGTHSGGGTVTFTVSADGSGITSFMVTGLPAGLPGCGGDRSYSFDPPLAVVNHTFSYGQPSGDSFSGMFPDAGAAEGTVRSHRRFQEFLCTTNVTWTATTTTRIWVDGDCNGAMNPLDSLKTLQTYAGFALTQTVAGCPAWGSNVTVNGITVKWGDVDCNGSVSPVDALKVLKTDAGFPPAQTVANCPALGMPVQVS